MITYPSTHGVFEEAIVRICAQVHAAGGQVYMDGANMNALAGLAKPALIGADVCHINLHKTFCIPHGGGGPGMGPIAVASHLAEFLPDKKDPISAAPYGSALILPISWMYIRMMGTRAAIRKATEIAILNANYIAARLARHFPVLYTGAHGRVAHECILDLRKLKETCGVSAEDVAKRLMDYGFHAPTLVPGRRHADGRADRERVEGRARPLLRRDDLDPRRAREDPARALGPRRQPAQERAAHRARARGRLEARLQPRGSRVPEAWLRAAKFWPPVKRIDNVAGDRNFVCTCPPIEAYA